MTAQRFRLGFITSAHAGAAKALPSRTHGPAAARPVANFLIAGRGSPARRVAWPGKESLYFLARPVPPVIGVEGISRAPIRIGVPALRARRIFGNALRQVIMIANGRAGGLAPRRCLCFICSMANANPLPSPATQFANGHEPKNGKAAQSAYSQLVECQRLLMDEMRSSAGKPVARAVVARAIKELEAQKREMRMLPKPKPVDVSPEALAKRLRKSRSGQDVGDREPQ